MNTKTGFERERGSKTFSVFIYLSLYMNTKHGYMIDQSLELTKVYVAVRLGTRTADQVFLRF